MIARASAQSAAPSTATTVAVLGVEPVEVPDRLAQQLTDALRKSVRNVSGYKQVQGKDLIEMKMVFGCDGDAPACIAQAGRSLGADKLVVGYARKSIRPTNIEVQLRLIDVKTKAQIGALDDVVSRSDVGARADAWLGKLFNVAAPVPVPNPTTLYVGSIPSGATVTIDGSQAGTTPLDLTTATPGKHTLRIELRGYGVIETTVELPAGKRTPLEFRLNKQETPVAPVALGPTQPQSVDPISDYVAQKPVPGLARARAVSGVGVAALVLGGVLGGVSIWSWYRYTNIESDLSDRVPLFVPNRPATAAETTWLKQPSCSPPSSLAEFGNTAAFASDCKEGRKLADVTTALVTTGTILGVGGLAMIITGWQLEQRAKKKAAGRDTRDARDNGASWLLVPSAAPGYAGLQASGRF